MISKSDNMKKDLIPNLYNPDTKDLRESEEKLPDDLFEEQSSENEKEKEGYYPADDEEEDELFIHDLHKSGYDGYRGTA